MSGVYFVINDYECWINDSQMAQNDAQLVSTSCGNFEFCIIKTNSENETKGLMEFILEKVEDHHIEENWYRISAAKAGYYIRCHYDR
jgi:hypothetical protein